MERLGACRPALFELDGRSGMATTRSAFDELEMLKQSAPNNCYLCKLDELLDDEWD